MIKESLFSEDSFFILYMEKYNIFSMNIYWENWKGKKL